MNGLSSNHCSFMTSVSSFSTRSGSITMATLLPQPHHCTPLGRVATVAQPSAQREGPMGLLDGKVGVVTGSGRGIGRGIALELAKEGAKVVVNDAGVDVDGRGGSEDPAAQACKEIEQLGGEGIPNYDDVSTF